MTTTTSRTQRLGWGLSPRGGYAVCKVPGRDCLALELRRPFSTAPRQRLRTPDLELDSATLLDEAGAVTVVTRDSEFLHLRSWNQDGSSHRWPGRVPATASVVPGPNGTAYAVETVDGHSRITRLTPRGAVSFGRLSLEVLDVRHLDATTLACNVVDARGHSRAVRYDTTTNVTTDFVNTSDLADDRVVAVRGDRVVVSTTASGEPRLGWGSLRTNRLRFPAAGAADRAMRLLAVSADGRTALAAEDRGLTVRLRRINLDTDTAVDLAPVLGQPAGSGRFHGEAVRFPLADLAHGATMVELTADGTFRHDDAPLANAPTARIATIDGPAGPIESLVLGDVARAARVVVALHGGPAAAWRPVHNPLFSDLVADGTAVVAPNIRGSIGYGRDHADAIRGRWGGPDGDDVLAIGRWVRGQRSAEAPPPSVFGESYGAFLAVHSAATAPQGTWAGCIAAATFTSGRRVHDLGTPVSGMVRRLGGMAAPDLLDLAADINVPVLLLHGEHDEVVPISESLALTVAMATAGGTVRLVRDPAGGHDVFCGPAAIDHRRRVCEAVREHQTREGR